MGRPTKYHRPAKQLSLRLETPEAEQLLDLKPEGESNTDFLTKAARLYRTLIERARAGCKQAAAALALVGIVEAGAFRPDTGMNQDNTYRYIAMAPDPRYPVDSQFAFQVMGDSMERAGIIEGMYVLGIDLYAWERLHGEPGDGKLVIVARTRDHHPERELTVKRLRIFRDRIELHPESGNPAHQPFVSKLPLSEASMEWQIIAVILSASWLFT